MKNNTEKVLKACNMLARKDNGDIDVFDLMYETGLDYPVLKAVLDRLVSGNELAETNLKTYKLTENKVVGQGGENCVKIEKVRKYRRYIYEGISL